MDSTLLHLFKTKYQFCFTSMFTLVGRCWKGFLDDEILRSNLKLMALKWGTEESLSSWLKLNNYTWITIHNIVLKILIRQKRKTLLCKQVFTIFRDRNHSIFKLKRRCFFMIWNYTEPCFSCASDENVTVHKVTNH